MAPDFNKIPMGEEQDRNVFNTWRRCLRDIDMLTDDQIAAMHFESWNVAYNRSGKRIKEELDKNNEN